MAVAPDAEIRDLGSPDGRVVDLAGGLVSASFVDSHLHPIMGGFELGQCNLVGAADAEECKALIRAYVDAHPDDEWIVGGGWQLSWFPGGTPTSDILDEICPDRPVSLANADHHGSWVNSRALALAGITAETPDPVDGRIERSADGAPSGTLHEGAAYLVDRVRPAVSPDELYAALLRAQEHCLALGITGWQDAAVQVRDGVDHLDVYRRALRDGSLKARVTAALWYDRQESEDQVAALLERRASVDEDPARFDADSVKIMVDGIAENFTAAMTQPYRDACGHETTNAGLSFVDVEVLGRVVAALDAAGTQVHFHALGDRAVVEALDAVANAARQNGTTGRRHHLAHVQVVQSADVRRFAELGAVANIQPYWARNEAQMTELTLPFLHPDLATRQYPFAEFAAAGVRLAGGSDWPVSSADPLAGMQVAVTRVAEVADEAKEPFLPEQALTLVQAWDAYTVGSSFVNRRENLTGAIAEGMLADLVVLAVNPFTVEPREIADCRVASTWIGGEPVYEADLAYARPTAS
ncbi:MAG TPA: amidohydrolase [Microbacterium sp.]|uniref:amidohydrolase n=1 Tax=Microbacterium sp. TaxID=51671 RepID=UPI002CE2B304|nr:amidohydrolase [Microbacterium sp.]HWI30049.1 amidohydrolase [Microbacterium sp.]